MSESAINEAAYPRLRLIDPRILKANPHNPRTTPATPAQDDQLRASIKARGIIQFPVVAEKNGDLFIRAGHRRVKAQIDLDAATIVVIETEPGNIDLMDALAENVVRAAMNSVDMWRAIEELEKQGWNEQAIADALALPVRTIRRLKLLAHIHPPMLDVMARGDMPDEEQLRTIAAATLEEQAQVWKKHKPQERTDQLVVRSRARCPNGGSRSRSPSLMTNSAPNTAWPGRTICSLPPGEDGRYTTNVDGFFGAQQEWLGTHLARTREPSAAGRIRPAASCRRRQNTSTANPPKATLPATISTRTPRRSKPSSTACQSEKKAAKGNGKDSTAPDAVTGQVPARRHPEGQRHHRRPPYRRSA